MTLKSCYRRKWPQRASSFGGLAFGAATIALLLLGSPLAQAGEQAPQWMSALANAPVPEHDEDTEAVLLYSERIVSVQSATSMKIMVRKAYRILRPEARRNHEYVAIDFGPQKKVTSLRAWCIPVGGKDYQVKGKEAADVAADVEGGELLTDVKYRVLQIPAVEPGNIIGYEYETEERPMILQDQWEFQQTIPVLDTRYSIDLPAGWSYETKWANYPEIKSSQSGNHGQWSLTNVKPIRKEEDMPALEGVAGQMVVYFVPPGEATNTFTNWRQMGEWYNELTKSRVDASSDLKQTVAGLTGSKTTTVAKMQAIGSFVQQNLRYVAIELGIGGVQPHPASEVLTHRYGDCKDKATLTISMLREIGVDAYYVLANVDRGAVNANTPASAYAFNHAVVAIRLPDGTDDPSLLAILQHQKYGKLLIFDPTDELTPFGQLGNHLQASYGMLAGPNGGELVQLPTMPASVNSVRRSAKLTLDANGMLTGQVNEVRNGDKAWAARSRMRHATKDEDRIRPIENILSDSLTSFQITKASVQNLNITDQPFGFIYSFMAPNYAKNTGGLLLVRPRVLGVKALGLASSKRPREYSFELSGVGLDTDSFDIAIPAGYAVDDLPEPADADYGFASYHAKTVVDGGIIHYSRSYEVKQVSVPVDQADKVKRFYQVVAGDERNMVVLKPSSK